MNLRALLVLVFISVSAYADPDSGSNLSSDNESTGVVKEKTPNMYVNFGGGVATFLNEPYASAFNNGFVGNVNLGYQLNRYTSVEVGYGYVRWMAKGHDTGLSASAHVEDIALRGVLPINNDFYLFGRLGLGSAFNIVSQSGSSTTVLFYTPILLSGVGVGYNINRIWSVRIDDTMHLGNTAHNGVGSVNTAGASVQYKF